MDHRSVYLSVHSVGPFGRFIGRLVVRPIVRSIGRSVVRECVCLWLRRLVDVTDRIRSQLLNSKLPFAPFPRSLPSSHHPLSSLAPSLPHTIPSRVPLFPCYPIPYPFPSALRLPHSSDPPITYTGKGPCRVVTAWQLLFFGDIHAFGENRS